MSSHGAVWRPEDDEEDEPQGTVYRPKDDEPTKQCKVCLDEKYLSQFRRAKGDTWTDTCQQCINEKRANI